MDQRKMTYYFQSNQDLTYKANDFINKVEAMNELGAELVHFIQNETNGNSGKIIEQINKTIEKHQQFSEQLTISYKETMRNAAIHYSDHINDMNTQNITLYYERAKIDV